MALLNFPLNPVNGQQYPNPAIPGVYVYQYSSSANTWLLLGRAGYAQPGTYGDNVTCLEITIDSAGLIRDIIERPIPDVTNTQKGLMLPGIGLRVDIPGTVNLIPPDNLGNIGGVKQGAHTNIAADGTISVPYATTATPGVVILNNTTTTDDPTQALTAAQGKYLQDQINEVRTDALVFCGTFNATLSQMDYVTYEGSLRGFAVGQNLPAPTAEQDNAFVIVSVPGTPAPPAPAQALGGGDWVYCDVSPNNWYVVPAGFFIDAKQVEFDPYSYVTGNEVQLAINQVIDRTNFFALTGGIGLSNGPYTLAGGAQTINLLPPTPTEIGGVVAGSNIVITPGGTISAVSGGGIGSVLEVATGVGLVGGPITSTGTISLANTAVTPGTYTYPELIIDQQGRITSATGGSITAGGGLFSTQVGPNITLNVGAGAGISVAADTVGILTATTSVLGGVKVDGVTIVITPDGTISTGAAAVGTLQQVTDLGATTTNTIVCSPPSGNTGLQVVDGAAAEALDITATSINISNGGLYARSTGLPGVDVVGGLTPNVRIYGGGFLSMGTGTTTFVQTIALDAATGQISTSGDIDAINITASNNLQTDGSFTAGAGLFSIIGNSPVPGSVNFGNFGGGGGTLLSCGASGSLSVINNVGGVTAEFTPALATLPQINSANLLYPGTDGTANQVISTNGAGVLGWLSTAQIVPTPINSAAPGSLGQIAFSTGFFYWHDGTQWLRVVGTSF